MRNKLMILAGALIMIILFMAMAHAEGKVSSYMFGDYAWIAQSNDADLDGKSGFVVRRIYATYNNDIDEKFSARIRLEMAQKDFSGASGKMEPVVKGAFLKYKSGDHDLYAGLSGTPTWGLVEKFWGYRWLEKTPLDLHKFGSSRDIGLACKGHLDEEKKIGYHFMIGQGDYTYNETDKGKKYYGALSYKATDQLIIEAYGDFEDSEDDTPNTASHTIQGFVGYKGDFGRIGAMYALNSAEVANETDSTIDVSIVSGFVVWKLSDNLNGVARLDYLLDPNSGAGGVSYLPMVATAKNTMLVILGVDYQAAKNVHIQPNVDIGSYGDDVTAGVDKADSELIPRVSIFYKF